MDTDKAKSYVDPAVFDRRLMLRTYCEIAALCAPTDGGPEIPVTMIDHSEGGARLRFDAGDAGIDIPKTFVLTIPSLRLSHVAEVLRINGAEVGVRYASENLNEAD